MSAVSADTGGVPGFAASMSQVAAALGDPAPMLADLATQVRGMAAANTPRATGALAASADVSAGQIDSNPAQLLTWGVRYAVFVNFGTRYMPARPFATDALAAATRQADAVMRTWAENALTKA